MSRISKDYFNDIYKPSHDFIDYGKAKALFKTKMVSDMKHNGEIVEVLGLRKGKDIFNDRYVVRFNNGEIEDNIMFVEINFDYSEKDIKYKKEKER